MLLTSDFNGGVTINVARDFKTNTKIALSWFETFDGNIRATDLTSAADKYQSIVTTYGTESYINNIITSLNDCRTKGYMYLSSFADNEKIFGENIDYSGLFISALFVGYNKRKKTSMNGYGLDIGLKLHKPTFVNYGTFNFATASAVSFNYDADKEININNYDTNTGDDYSYDKDADIGYLKYTVNLNTTQYIQLLNYQRTIRGSTFELPPIPGITYPFGPADATELYNVKLISVEHERFGLNRFLATIELREIR
jgi:hypothetical protein